MEFRSIEPGRKLDRPMSGLAFVAHEGIGYLWDACTNIGGMLWRIVRTETSVEW